jgi:uncharacterized protein (TIGR02145 family)
MADAGGTVVFDGGTPVTARGVCWNTNGNPTLADSFTTDGSGSGPFTSNLTGLTASTIYYVSAYATNSRGTTYGPQVSFTTLQITVPVADVSPAYNIGQNSISINGIISSSGGSPVTARGFCWGTTPDPTISGNHSTNGSGMGVFIGNITGLIPNTFYYIRAYGTNNSGTGYTPCEVFTTLQVILPNVLTNAVINIAPNTATSGGNVVSDGGAAVSARGVCWSTSQMPTIASSHTSDGTGLGTFTSNLTGLTPGTPYYLRAYATNSSGTKYGLQVTFSTPATCNGVTQVAYSGKTYNTISIGTQCWIKQNLNVGTRIDGGTPQTNNGGIEKYCYNDLVANCDIYGGLYQWDELMGYISIQGIQGICPPGWHVPTDAEYTTLTTFLGGYIVAGGKLKETGFAHWNSPNTGATNETGFTALPGGDHFPDTYENIGNYGFWWTSSSYNGSLAWHREMDYDNPYFYRFNDVKENAFSVRCLMGAGTATTPTVTTSPASFIGKTSATGGGNVTSDGGAEVIARGVCWSTSPAPTTNGSFTLDGTGTGNFVSNLTGLTENTTYYVRAYAINSWGTGYGNEISFTTFPWECGDDVNYQGMYYPTVGIGSRCWFKKNLNVGTQLVNGSFPQTDNGVIEKYCYDNLVVNCNIYGGLYQWDEAIQYSATATTGICPTGWHVPIDAEWTTLSSYLGGADDAGGNMKATGTAYWASPNTGATNSSGFTGLPGGNSNSAGVYGGMTYYGNFWSSSESSTDNAWMRQLYYTSVYIFRGSYDKSIGYSVRCIKN